MSFRATIAYYSAFIALGFATSVLGPALPSLATHTQTSVGEIGFLFTGASFGYMVGSLGVGKLLDRAPGNIILTSLLLIMSISLACIPLISSLWLLTVILFVLGISEGGLDLSANLLLVWVHRQRANPYLNALHFFFGIGALLAPIFIAQSILSQGDIHWAFWILAIYPIPAGIWLLKLPAPRSPEYHGSTENLENHWHLVGLIALVFVFYIGAEVGFGGWIFTYAVTLNLMEAAGAAYLTSVFWASLTVGRLLGISIAARFSPAAILLGDFAGCLLSLIIIWLFPGMSILVWVGTFALGVFMASIFPTLLAFSERHLTLSGRITRWFFLGTGLGGMILPYLMGILIEKNGPLSIIPVLWLDLILALLAFLGCILISKNIISQDTFNNKLSNS